MAIRKVIIHKAHEDFLISIDRLVVVPVVVLHGIALRDLCPLSREILGSKLIELEAECCSLDSLGAFTDECYCCPAVTRSMHSDDTHSQMWVGSVLTSKARSPIYSNLHRDPNGTNQRCRCLLLHVCHSFTSRPITVSFAQNVRMSLRCRIRISMPAQVRLHTQVSSESRPPGHWADDQFFPFSDFFVFRLLKIPKP